MDKIQTSNEQSNAHKIIHTQYFSSKKVYRVTGGGG